MLNFILKTIKFYDWNPTGIQIVDLTYRIVTGPTHLGNDSGMTLVTDGSTVKITPLSIANVPPPISFREFDINGNINDLAISKSNEKYAVLSSEGDIYLSELSLNDMKQGKTLKSTIKYLKINI